MENKDLKKNFFKFPGVISVEGKRNYAYINIADGNIFSVDKDLVNNPEKKDDLLSEFENAGLGLTLEKNHPLRQYFNYQIDVPIEEGLKVSLLENFDYIKYIEMPVESVNVFYSGPGVNRDELYKSAIYHGYHGSIKIEKYDPEKCPFYNFKEPSVSAYFYFFNCKYNHCWGRSLAIDADGNVKPCLWSEIKVGNIKKDSFDRIKGKLDYYWKLTKDKIEICKDCELKYVCSDCRVYSEKQNGSILSKTLFCDYNPSSGEKIVADQSN